MNRTSIITSLLALTALFIFTETSIAAPKTAAKCPRKVLETKTVEGIYQGTDCGDSCYMDLTLDNGENFYVYADPGEVEKIFGKKTGKRISMTYTVEQYWNFDNVEETNPNGPGSCARGEFFKTGKILK